jgi:hypothetical protein
VVFLEDSDEPLGVEETLEYHKVKHHGHIHIHKCRKVNVIVAYDGKKIERHFSPPSRIVKVLEWCVEEFRVPDHEKQEMLLRLSPESDPLGKETRIGSLVTSEKCEVILQLFHEHERGPKYLVDIEGNVIQWDHSTITTEQIIKLGGWPVDKGAIEVNLKDNTERNLSPGEVVEIKPGHAFSKRILFKRGKNRV